MQTFLPYPTFVQSLAVLDRQRLGKQRVEVLQMLNALLGIKKGWRSHAATRMWEGNEFWLAIYGKVACSTWIKRGYRDTTFGKIHKLQSEIILPSLKGHIPPFPEFISDPRINSSHRAALLFKDYGYYRRFGWSETPMKDYYWHKPKGT